MPFKLLKLLEKFNQPKAGPNGHVRWVFVLQQNLSIYRSYFNRSDLQ
jgi:hypothetical protein